MRLEFLGLGYLAMALVVAAAAMRRKESALDVLLILIAWPLYLPLWLRKEAQTPALDPASQAAERVRDALSSVQAAAAGTPFAELLDAHAGLRLREELQRATQRVRAIEEELARESGPPTSSATLHLRAESQASLRTIRERDLAAMSELAELLATLRTRIVLAQHTGSLTDGPEAMVSEVWARIVGLGEAMEGSGPRAVHGNEQPAAPA